VSRFVVDENAGVPRSVAADRLGVSPHTVSMWALRGWRDPDGTHRRLSVVGRDRRQRLYRWGDLLDAERATRRSPNSRRAA
jgi:hypothetical protein